MPPDDTPEDGMTEEEYYRGLAAHQEANDMPCPTCTHTMPMVGTSDGGRLYHCRNCGTLRYRNARGEDIDTVPTFLRELFAPLPEFALGKRELAEDLRNLNLIHELRKMKDRADAELLARHGDPT